MARAFLTQVCMHERAAVWAYSEGKCMIVSVLALVSTHAQRPRLHSLCIRIAHSERPLCPAAFDLAVTRANGPSALMRQLSKRRHPTPNVADRFVLDSDDRTGNAADQLTRQRLLCRLVVATRSLPTPMQQYAAIGDCVRLLWTRGSSQTSNAHVYKHMHAARALNEYKMNIGLCWLSDRPTGRPTDRPTDRTNERPTDRTNERTNERMN